MKYLAVLGLLLLVACSATPMEENSDLDPKLHGMEVASESNMGVVGTHDLIIKEPEYYPGVTGYYARPNTTEPVPGVIMIHEWWGLNENIKNTARQLAQEGYQVLAVDLFGTVATTSDEARTQVQAFNQEIGISNMQAAAGFLQERQASSLGTLGWCFGGAQSLQMSIATDIDATVMYYGNVVTDDSLAAMEQPLLGIFGSEDSSIPLSDVRAFEAALNRNNVQNSITIYDGVGHAFANPSGNRYAPQEAADAWKQTLNFLNNNLE